MQVFVLEVQEWGIRNNETQKLQRASTGFAIRRIVLGRSGLITQVPSQNSRERDKRDCAYYYELAPAAGPTYEIAGRQIVGDTRIKVAFAPKTMLRGKKKGLHTASAKHRMVRWCMRMRHNTRKMPAR
jgi:hypothetical protein